MILYFSGTGNSEYAARRISTETKDKLMNLGERIRSRDFSGIHSDTPWVVAAPTYAWRIPRVLEEWLKNTELRGNKNIYFVMTCGGNIGNAGRYLKKLARSKGLDYRGCAQIVMPENYIAMFTTPTQEEAAGIIRGSLRAIDEAARQIKDSRPPPASHNTKRQNQQQHSKHPLLPNVRPRQKVPGNQCLHILRQMRRHLPPKQHPSEKRNPGLGKKLHPLHGLHKPLSNPSHRIRKPHKNPPPLHLPQKHIIKK